MAVNQILLLVVIVALAALLCVIGIQVFFILREVRRSLQKMNKMLDNAGQVAESIAKPIVSLSSSLTGFSGIAGILSWLARRKKRKEEEEENE